MKGLFVFVFHFLRGAAVALAVIGARRVQTQSVMCNEFAHGSGDWRVSGRRSGAPLKRKKWVVAKDGIEPPTQGFSVLCSTN
jgi:hypothetical protein